MKEENKESWEDEFERLDIVIERPHSIMQEETYEKYKLIFPIAWEMFKPSVKSFILKVEKEAYQRAVETMEKELINYGYGDILEKFKAEKAQNEVAFNQLQALKGEEIKEIPKEKLLEVLHLHPPLEDSKS